MTFPTRLEPTSNAADWESETIELFDADTGAALDLTGLTFAMELCADKGGGLVRADSASGGITVSANTLLWVIPEQQMKALRPGTYTVFLRATETATGAVDQLLATPIQIYEGGFK